MAALSTRVTLTVRDRFANEARIVFHVAPGIVDPNDATIQAIVTAINACMNSVGVYIELTQVNTPAGSVVDDVPYVSTDKAIFPALDQDGQPHNFKVPGPIVSAFEADGYTVDMTFGAVVAYVDAVTTHARGRNGADVTVLTSGYRWANRKALKG